MAHYPPATEEVWRTTVNLARVETPNQAFNQIPAEAQAWLDIRFPAEDGDLQGRTAAEITRLPADLLRARGYGADPRHQTRRITPTMIGRR